MHKIDTVFTLSKSAKLNWGLGSTALQTIYIGGILPLLLYGAPVWENIMNIKAYRNKLTRVQRLILIKIAKSYRTVSNEALCVLTGQTPIDIKIEESASLYQHTRLKGTHTDQTDYDMETKYWTHPAHSIKILEEDEQSKGTLQVFTDGSKSQEGVGSGIAIYDQDSLIQTLKYKLNRNCTNNQAEQLAILKALQFAEKYLNNYKTATIYTDSRITLDSLRRRRHHAYLIEEVRRQVTSMQQNNWNVEFSWVKAHIGIQGNETADRLAKEAAESRNIVECYSKIPKSVITSELKSKSEQKWQRDWDQTTKGAITK